MKSLNKWINGLVILLVLFYFTVQCGCKQQKDCQQKTWDTNKRYYNKPFKS